MKKLLILTMALLPLFQSNVYPDSYRVTEEVITVEAPRYRKMFAEITAYTASAEENGGYTGITVEGKPLEEGMLAMDGIPLGTKVIIDGAEYVVADRIGEGKPHRIDKFTPSRADAMRWGRQHKEVLIEEEQ